MGGCLCVAVLLKSPEVPALWKGDERRSMSTDCHPAAQKVTAHQNVPGERVSRPVTVSTFPKWVSPALCSPAESVTRGTWTERGPSLERGQITPSSASAAPSQLIPLTSPSGCQNYWNLPTLISTPLCDHEEPGARDGLLIQTETVLQVSEKREFQNLLVNGAQRSLQSLCTLLVEEGSPWFSWWRF